MASQLGRNFVSSDRTMQTLSNAPTTAAPWMKKQIKPIFLRGDNLDQWKRISMMITDSLVNTEYITSISEPATVYCFLPLTGPQPMGITGLLLYCETQEQRQDFHLCQRQRVVMPITAFTEGGKMVEADTYVYPVESILEEYWDYKELHACVSPKRHTPFCYPPPNRPPWVPEDENSSRRC